MDTLDFFYYIVWLLKFDCVLRLTKVYLNIPFNYNFIIESSGILLKLSLCSIFHYIYYENMYGVAIVILMIMAGYLIKLHAKPGKNSEIEFIQPDILITNLLLLAFGFIYIVIEETIKLIN
jgi:hypothetical protein